MTAYSFLVLALALTGAVLGLINVRDLILSRGRLVVTSDVAGKNVQRPAVSVVNRGRVPLTISEIGLLEGRFSRRRYAKFPFEPERIEPGEVKRFRIATHEPEVIEKLRFAYATTACGRRFAGRILSGEDKAAKQI